MYVSCKKKKLEQIYIVKKCRSMVVTTPKLRSSGLLLLEDVQNM